MAIASESFTGVDLSRLPAPDVIETLDFETLRAAWIADFQAKFPGFDATVESDPIVKLCEVGAYRELIMRQRANDAARAVMVAYAKGADLDNLAALFEVERYIITPADPETGAAAVLESDDDFRRRVVLAPEGYSVAGPAGAYIFHALGASSDVADASATSPDPGEVLVTVLSRGETGVPSGPVLAAVTAALNADTVRPLTDFVTVAAAVPVDFAILATLTFRTGPDKTVVLAAAQAALADYLAQSRRLGRSVTRAGIIAALFADGVQNVELDLPATDQTPTSLQFARCTGITLTDGGTAS